MKNEYFISIYLDTRRKLKDFTYPVKLRVFTPAPRKQKLYPTKFKYSTKDFESIWETQKPLNIHKDARREIQLIVDYANSIAKKLNPFTHEEFEKQFKLKKDASGDIISYYTKKITDLKSIGKLNTAENYSSSLRSIKEFLKHETGKIPAKILFVQITVEFLKKYEYYMLNILKRKLTTVGIYLRPLRAIFNQAKLDNAITDQIYPFNKGLYQIPSPRKFKKSLSKEQLRALFEAVPSNSQQELARDFWFFLYNAAGMNVKDLALLRYENIQNDKIVYIREKTKQTAKTNALPVIVYLNDYSYAFIDNYGHGRDNPKSLVFDILNENMNESEQRLAIKNFTRFINQHIQKLAEANGLPKKISTYWSRHTFATNAIRNGASLEKISQALNHQDITTTLNYFAGFEDEAMREITDNLMYF